MESDSFMGEINRKHFVEMAAKFSALAALAGCSGAASSLPTVNIGGKLRRTQSTTQTSSGRIITSNWNASGVTVTCTDTNGQNPQTILTVTGNAASGIVTYNAYHYGVFQINAPGYTGGSVSAYGHTITPVSAWDADVGQANISGPTVSGYAKHDLPNATMYGNDRTYTSSTYRYIDYGGSGGGGGICRRPPCPLAGTSGLHVTWHTVLAGIGFAAGVTALVFFGPEMAVAEIVLAGTGTIADEIDFFKSLFGE